MIPVTVIDENGSTDRSQIQITVIGTNDAPVAGAEVTRTIEEGSSSITGQLTSSDVDDNATATFTLTEGNEAPAGFVLNEDGSYRFDSTDPVYDYLNVGDSEVVTIPVTVTDDKGATDTTQIVITVTGTDDAPVVASEVTRTLEEGSATIYGQLDSSDVDDNAAPAYSIREGSEAPAGFVFNGDGSYSFDPAHPTYDHLEIGDTNVLTVPVSITLPDGSIDTTQIQITVTGTNDAPVAALEKASVDEGAGTISGQLVSSDVDDNATATFALTEGSEAPAGFVLNQDGSYTFDPADSVYDHLNVDDEEVVTIPVTVTDEHGADSNTQIQITVNGTNDAPVAYAEEFTFAEFQPLESMIRLDEEPQFGSMEVEVDGQWTVMQLGTEYGAESNVRFAPDGSGGSEISVGTFGSAKSSVDDWGTQADSKTRVFTDGDSQVTTQSLDGKITAQNYSSTYGWGILDGDGYGISSDEVFRFTPDGGNALSANFELNGLDRDFREKSAGSNNAKHKIQITAFDADGNQIQQELLSAPPSATSANFSLTTDVAADYFEIKSTGSSTFVIRNASFIQMGTTEAAITTIDNNGGETTEVIALDNVGASLGSFMDVTELIAVDHSAPLITGQLRSSDLDDAATAVFTISEGNEVPIGFVLNPDGSYTFDPNDPAYDSMNAGDSLIKTIPVTVTDDNGATDTTQIRITVTGSDDAPVTSIDTFAVDEGASLIDGQLTISDVDNDVTASTFSIADGTEIPSGFALNEDGSYSFDAADVAYDYLNVGMTKELIIPVTVSDAAGIIDTTQITITVTGTNDAPVAGVEVKEIVAEGGAVISGQLTSTDLDDNATAAFTITEDTATPAGFVLNADGSYSFDPADAAYDHLNVGDSTILTIPVTVTDDNGATDTAQIQITVNGTNDAPVAAIEKLTVNEGASSITGQLNSGDVDDGATATFTLAEEGQTPAGFVFNEDGSYTFDPTDTAYDHLHVGSYDLLTIPVIVTDNNGATATTQIQITVRGTNDAPVAQAEVTRTVEEGSASITGQLTSSDVDDNATATFTLTQSHDAPAGFMLNEDGSYSFDPTDPAYDYLNVGVHTTLTIPVTVSDEHGATDTTQIVITVTGTDDAPVVASEVVRILDEGSAAIYGQFDSLDVDNDVAAVYGISTGSEAPEGFVLNADGSYSFDPANPAYDYLNVGVIDTLRIPVTITLPDSSIDTTYIEITVIGTNDVPVVQAIEIAAVTEGDAEITGQLISSDVDDNATATFTLAEGNEMPAGFVLSDDGSYSFDPTDPAYDYLNEGEPATLIIPVTVTDDHDATDTTEIRITITGTNDVPIAEDVTETFAEGSSAITGQLVFTDLDANSTATFTLEEGSEAPAGFILNEDGSYNFDPGDLAYDHLKLGSQEVLTIPVTLTDDNGATDSIQLQITVTGTNDAPVAILEEVAVDEGASSITGQLIATDVDDDSTATFTLTGGREPPAGFVLNEDGSYNFDPADPAYDYLNEGEPTTLIIPVTVTDDNGATDTTQIRITVTGTNDAPIAESEVATTLAEGGSIFRSQLTSSDLDASATVTFTISDGGDAPAGFVLNADGAYSFDPNDPAYDAMNVGDSVIKTIPVTVTDDIGATDTTQIQITITGTDDAPVTSIDTLAVDEGAGLIDGQLTISDVDNDVTASTFAIADGAETPSGFILNEDGSYSFDPADADYDYLNVGMTEELIIPVAVSDVAGIIDTTQITITVTGTNDAPIAGVEVTRLPVAEGDAVISGQLTSTDLDDHATKTFTVSPDFEIPAGFVLNDDGSYSFDPNDPAYDAMNVGDSVIKTIPVTVTDDNGAIDTTQVQITITGTNDAPVAETVTRAVREGSASIGGVLTLSDVDDVVNTAVLTFTIAEDTAIPSGFELTENGAYNFDPTDPAYDHLKEGDLTTLTIPVTITNENGETSVSRIQITVIGTNDTPVAGAEVTKELAEGSAVISGQLTSTDLDDHATAAFTVSAGSETPAGFILSEDGSYSFDPTDPAYDHLDEGVPVTLTIPVTVTDDHGATDTTQIRITVTGTNDLPVAEDVTKTLAEGSAAITGQMSYSDPDDNASATFTLAEESQAPAGFVLNEDGSYSFDPADAAYDHLSVGTYTTLTIPVTVTDSDGTGDTAQIQINVIGTNDAPVATLEEVTVDEGASSISGQLTATDVDDDSTVTFAVTEESQVPAGFVLKDDGSYSFDPTDPAYDHLNVGMSTTLTIPVIVTDNNGATDTTQIRLTVIGTNDAPIAGAEVTNTLTEDSTAITGQLTSTDVDDNATASYAITAGSETPVGFMLNDDGSYSFDPTGETYDYLNVGDSKILIVPVTVTDENGATDTTQIKITVTGTDDSPVVVYEQTTVDEGDPP